MHGFACDCQSGGKGYCKTPDERGVTAGGASSRPVKNVKRKYELDLDILDCPACMEPLSPPVFQCLNGHMACSACCKNLGKRCYSCSKPIRTRNRAVEKVIESLRVSFMHSAHGCHEMPQFTMKKEHEKLCVYRPWNCPTPGCKHSGPRSGWKDPYRSSYIQNVHGTQTVQLGIPGLAVKATFTVHPSELFVILGSWYGYDYRSFLLHHEKTRQGHIFFITSLEDKGEPYKLEVQMQNKLDNYVIEAVTKDIADEENWRTNFILVPKNSAAAISCPFEICVRFNPGFKYPPTYCNQYRCSCYLSDKD